MKQTNILHSAVALGALYGIPAAFMNAFFSLPLYGLVTLHVGQMFVILALMTRGLPAALIAGIISTAGLYVETSNAFFFVTLSLELVVMIWLNRRGLSFLLSNFIYWLVIGAPISYIYLESADSLPTDFMVLVLVKLMLNGILYTAMASTIYHILPMSWRFVSRPPVAPTLFGRIFYLSFISIMIPSLIIALILTARGAKQAEEQIVGDLYRKANNARLITRDLIAEHERVVKQLSDTLAITDRNEHQAILTRTQLNYPSFLTMLIASADGYITHGAPESFFETIRSQPLEELNVSDRDYFRRAVENKSPFVSSVFIGRGFGADTIIAVSSPIIRDGQVVGVAEGSLNLPKLSSLEERQDIGLNNQLLVITDIYNRVVYASEPTNLAVYDVYTPTAAHNVYTRAINMTRLNSRNYLIANASNNYGWNIYVMSRPQQITQVFMDNLLVFLFSLFGVTALFLLVTNKFSRDMTRPLETLVDHMTSDASVEDLEKSEGMTTELKAISGQLSKARRLMLDFNRQLKQQVQDKTQELEALNKRLHQLSQEDGLTELLNRRTFDELTRKLYSKRCMKQQPVHMLLMDIDNFKDINDSMGHPIGDECIVSVAKELQRFFNHEEELVSRYGGEEFAVVSTASSGSLLERLEQFRSALTRSCIVDGTIIPMTVSAGLLSVEKDFNLTYTDLMIRVDQLLYTSKREGRDRVTHELR
ncbi:MAG TPA: diguanylate cyclase [Pseudidiomarina sp.]|nr:diguanylate cyclase [Pseudidiomarina sp.]